MLVLGLWQLEGGCAARFAPHPLRILEPCRGCMLCSTPLAPLTSKNCFHAGLWQPGVGSSPALPLPEGVLGTASGNAV